MSKDMTNTHPTAWPTLAQLPIPAKALVSCIILTMAIAMLGALGQIMIHDIIPTFFAESSGIPAAGMSMESMQDSGSAAEGAAPSARGDLFAEDTPAPEEKAHSMPFYSWR